MARPVLANMGHGGLNIGHDARRHDHVEVLLPPIRLARRNRAGDILKCRIGAHLDTGIDQGPDHAFANGLGDTLMDQQTLRRAADARAPCLGVQHHFKRFFRVGLGVDIDMHNPFEVRKDRHARLTLHQPDKSLTAPRHDHVDGIGHG